MICTPCSNGHHKKCKKRNEGKQGLYCDCQHRKPKEPVKGKTDGDVSK